jgi:cyclomaltodextrinase / maltogenic alpha-amylase / neopullulanase
LRNIVTFYGKIPLSAAFFAFVFFSLFSMECNAMEPAIQAPNTYANETDKESAASYAAREKDWRNGAIVYQVLVDRFAPSANIEAKKALYPAPKVLRKWSDLPKRGSYLEKEKLWSHEIDFWGGDLQSTSSKLSYVHELGADVLYLNPIHLAYTNHKYDALDYLKVSPEFGTRDDVKKLSEEVHKLGMKMVLDGVFNHMGRNSEAYKQAVTNPKSPYRDWFYFGAQYAGGSRSWAGAENLPELNLENAQVRDHIFAKPDSVVQSYLADGVDGWRLDVAYDIGFRYLGELTRAAHARKPGSLVVGEIANYPREWFPSVDAVMNFTLREIIIKTAKGEIETKSAAQMFDRIVTEAGIEPMLKSWTMLDNHDTQRLHTVVPNEAARKLAQVLQFTLPGAPNLYYGTELGMAGGDDPEMRAPMRWDIVEKDRVTKDNATLNWTKKLIALHKQNRALRIGNFRLVSAQKLLAFERYTDRVEDTVIVLMNPTKSEITETVMVANSKLMNFVPMRDQLDASSTPVNISSALLNVTLPAGAVRVLKPEVKAVGGYTPYKRVQ